MNDNWIDTILEEYFRKNQPQFSLSQLNPQGVREQDIGRPPATEQREPYKESWVKTLLKVMMPLAAGAMMAKGSQVQAPHGGTVGTKPIMAQGLRTLAKSIEQRQQAEQELRQAEAEQKAATEQRQYERKIDFLNFMQRQQAYEKTTKEQYIQGVYDKYMKGEITEEEMQKVLGVAGETSGITPSLLFQMKKFEIGQKEKAEEKEEELAEKAKDELWEKRAYPIAGAQPLENNIRAVLAKMDKPKVSTSAYNAGLKTLEDIIGQRAFEIMNEAKRKAPLGMIHVPRITVPTKEQAWEQAQNEVMSVIENIRSAWATEDLK